MLSEREAVLVGNKKLTLVLEAVLCFLGVAAVTCVLLGAGCVLGRVVLQGVGEADG